VSFHAILYALQAVNY
jgi:hypothetical protein